MPTPPSPLIDRRRWLALLPAGALLAACGGGDSDSDDSGGLPPASPSPLSLFNAAAAAQLAKGSLPSLAIGAGGNALAVYLSRDAGLSIRSRRFNAGTGVFEAETIVHALSPNVAVDVGDLQVKFNAQGTVAVAVWLAQNTLNSKIVFAEVYRNGAWQGAQPLSIVDQEDGTDAAFVDLAFDAQSGDAMVVWTDPLAATPATRFSRLRAGQTLWDAPRTVVSLKANAQLLWSHRALRLAALPDGDFMLVAVEKGPRPVTLNGDATYLAVYRYRANLDQWGPGNGSSFGQALYFLPDATTDGVVAEFDVAVNQAGQLLAVWAQDRAPSTQIPPQPRRRSIELARFNPASGAWSAAQSTVDVTSIGTNPADSPGWRSGFPCAAIDAAGKAVIVWAQQDLVNNGDALSLHTRRFDAAANTFTDGPDLIAATSGVGAAPALAINSEGDVLAVWSHAPSNQNTQVRFALRVANAATFSAPGLAGLDVAGRAQPALAFGPDGKAIALWSELDDTLRFNRTP
jgi:hypothetical protein